VNTEIRYRIPLPSSDPSEKKIVQIGTHVLRNNLFVAPMAGVTDRPFRQLCKRFGAGLAVSEMVSSQASLRETRKGRLRTDHTGEADPIAVQIAGADPEMMADAARYNVDRGAQIIDINMGCPVKKVCNTMAGSSLLRDEALVGRILESVARAVPVPVTLKFRTGWDAASRNAITVARIAEQSGIRALALHGRTRACGFAGDAEYDTLRAVKQATRLPVIANGDISTPGQAKRVLDYTGADGVMIGRAAQGRPWIFREIEHHIATGETAPAPLVAEIRAVLIEHLDGLYSLYGAGSGMCVARKHIGWYTRGLPGGEAFRRHMNTLGSCALQISAVKFFFDGLAQAGDRLRYDERLAA